MKSKGKIGFSLFRVLITLFIVGLLSAVLILTDRAIERQTHYCDFNPLLTRDGKKMIFIRWFWRQSDRIKLMEIWEAHSDGSEASRIYSFDPSIHFYGLRFFRLSEDGKSVLARLLLKDPEFKYAMRDFLYMIPLATSPIKPIITQLPKTSPYDMIMDYQNDTMLARRVGDPKENSIVFMRYDGIGSYSVFRYPKDLYCNAGTLYQGGNYALVLFEKEKLTGHRFILVKLKKGLDISQGEMELDANLVPPLYLQSRKQFVSIDRNNPGSFLVIDESLHIVKQIPNPLSDHNTVFEVTVSPDEKYIIHPSGNKICRIDIDTGKSTTMKFPVSRIVPPIHQNPIDGEIVFSDGKQIFASDGDGTGLRALTQLSPKSHMEGSGIYIAYRGLREKCFGFVCRLFGIVCDADEDE